MTFTQTIYEEICRAMPATTTRQFSRYCGKSDGYYGSICAQQLEISTNALIYLSVTLEQMLVTGLNYDPRACAGLRKAQQMIADEIALRAHDMDIANLAVRKMIVGAVAKVAYRRDQQYNLPPIILG